jgi:hypothetical protein
MAIVYESPAERKNSSAFAEELILVSIIVFTETIFTVNRAITAGAKGNLCLNPASRAGHIVHFTLLGATVTIEATIVLLFAGCSALRATARQIGEPFLSIKVLLRSRENELGAAIAAG